jgi:hypothetical protein
VALVGRQDQGPRGRGGRRAGRARPRGLARRGRARRIARRASRLLGPRHGDERPSAHDGTLGPQASGSGSGSTADRQSASHGRGGRTHHRPADAPPKTAASTGYGILVGTYLFEDKANSERDRLSGLTGLPGIVNATGSSSNFAVILGNFSSRKAAAAKAGALVDSSVVTQAQVVARPK